MENKELIGRKVRGFKFDSDPYEFKLQYVPHNMNEYVGIYGIIKSYDSYLDAYQVLFFENEDNEDSFHYPASEIEKHLVEEKDWSVTINSPTQQIDMELLDKFALAALPSVINRVSINLTHEAIAQHAYNIARDMMKERSKI